MTFNFARILLNIILKLKTRFPNNMLPTFVVSLQILDDFINDGKD